MSQETKFSSGFQNQGQKGQRGRTTEGSVIGEIVADLAWYPGDSSVVTRAAESLSVNVISPDRSRAVL